MIHTITDLPINLAHKLGIGDQYEIWLQHESQGAGALQKVCPQEAFFLHKVLQFIISTGSTAD